MAKKNRIIEESIEVEETVEPIIGVVNVHSLNCRKEPSMYGELDPMGPIKEGTEVTIINEENGWYEIEALEGRTCFVNGDFITVK